MSEDNQVTTAIPRTLDTDATVVTPKPDAPAAPSASDETRVNPKITPEVMDAELARAEQAAKAAAGPVRDRTGRVKTTSSGAVRPARKARLRIAKLDPRPHPTC